MFIYIEKAKTERESANSLSLLFGVLYGEETEGHTQQVVGLFSLLILTKIATQLPHVWFFI